MLFIGIQYVRPRHHFCLSHQLMQYVLPAWVSWGFRWRVRVAIKKKVENHFLKYTSLLFFILSTFIIGGGYRGDICETPYQKLFCFQINFKMQTSKKKWKNHVLIVHKSKWLKNRRFRSKIIFAQLAWKLLIFKIHLVDPFWRALWCLYCLKISGPQAQIV